MHLSQPRPVTSYGHWGHFEGWSGARNFLSDLIALHSATTVLEAGSGANPTLGEEVAQAGIRYITTDVEGVELGKARAGCEPRVLDLALADLEQMREVPRRAEAVPRRPVRRLALRLLALTAARPSGVRSAAWAESEGLGGSEPLSRVPAEGIKTRRDHTVPLSPQAAQAPEAAWALTGRGPRAFPSARQARRPASENAIGYPLNRASNRCRHVPHGWRATFPTLMNERRRADWWVIDLMLACAPKDRVEGAYNRAAHLARRREPAQERADDLPARTLFCMFRPGKLRTGEAHGGSSRQWPPRTSDASRRRRLARRRPAGLCGPWFTWRWSGGGRGRRGMQVRAGPPRPSR